nr:unnamed protein product [Digitaria exilis]
MKLLCFFLLCLCSQALVSPRGNNCTDQLALLSFKSMLSSGPSSLLASWNTSNHFCSWPGVVCGHQQPVRVIALRMGTFNLSGLISPFLGNLSFLKELDLHGNQLVGKIPPELGHLGGLQVLNVSLNYLQGSIPVTLQVCAKLTSLDLSNNYLQGEIPSEMGTLKKLVFLNLEKNGIDSTWDDFKAIVYDFMPNGSLESWLHQDANDHQAEQRYLNIYDRVTILLDVAYALDYLHCHGLKPVVHCDLKSSNVLLDADMVAHVGDFGLAKILVKRSSSLQQSTSSMGFRGTIGYAAPG